MYRVVAICVLILACAFTAGADQLIVNGGFESGLTGWTVTDDASGSGSFFANTGTLTPLNGFPTVGAHSGTGYAVTDQFGPGSHAISQSFAAAAGDHYTLTFSMFVNDQFGGNFGGLVYLVAGGGDPLAGIGQALYSADTIVTNGAPNPYVTETIDITGDLVGGNTYQLVFFESDSVGPVNVGVDDVSLVRTPEPAGLMPISLALLAGFVALRKKA